MRSTVLVLLLWLLTDTGVAQDSSHYGVSIDEPRDVLIDDDGALAALAEKELWFMPGPARFQQLALPKLQSPVLLALGEGVWLHAGRTIAYAPLEKARAVQDYSTIGKLAWRTLELATDVAGLDDESARFDEQGRLLVQVRGGGVLRLTASTQGITSELVTLSLAPRAIAYAPVDCTSNGDQVELTYHDEAGASRTLTLPKLRRGMFEHEHKLCDAHVAHLHGRVWFASDDHVFSQEQGSWLVLSRRESASVWARASLFLRYQVGGSGLLLIAAAVLLGVTSWVTPDRSRTFARSLGASLLAPPCAWLSAAVSDVIGHGAGTSGHGINGVVILLVLLPFALLSLALPAVGAWLGERFSGQRTRGHFGLAWLAALVGTLFALPLTLPLLRSYLQPLEAVMKLVLACTLIGVCAAFAFKSAPASD